MGGSLSATQLRCERQSEPLGVGAERPVFAWIPASDRRGDAQTAYRVLVASDAALLTEGAADLWDSGRVESDDVSGVRYSGAALESRTRYWWSVQLWDRDGEPGAPSAPASFETALLRPDEWTAEWIGAHERGGSPILRREFALPGPVRRARAYVTGLGYFELRLNGQKVGDRQLEPAQTNYDHIPDLKDGRGEPARLRATRVIYAVHDVTDLLREGDNAVGLILGHGWYSPDQEGLFHVWGDRPRGLVQLEVDLESGERVTVASDGTWRVAAGPIVFDSSVHGEHYDARREQDGWDDAGFDDSAWTPADLPPRPDAVLGTTPMEPIRIIETIEPIGSSEPRPGVRIVDLGQNISGWSRIRVTGSAGATVSLRHASQIDAAGELDDRANMTIGPEDDPGARQTDVYTLRGGGSETWEPRFTVHGFRYVEVIVTGDARVESLDGRVVHTDLPLSSRFGSSNDLLDQIERNVVWTFRASFQGYPQDAGERSERVGWLGDPGWVIEDYLFATESASFWIKWLDDILDTQLETGETPMWAPLTWRGGYGPALADWCTTYPLIVWYVYLFTGDRTVLERHYDGIRRTLDWYGSHAVDGVISEVGLGDHMEPQPDGLSEAYPQHTPVPLTSTAWLFRIAQIVSWAADVLGDADGGDAARALAASVGTAFQGAFFDAESARYGSGSQTSLAVPLWFDIVPEEHRQRVGAALVEQIVEHDGGRFTTGTVGTSALEQVLPEIGAADLMYDLATGTEYPSWGDQIRQGATTVWEAWGSLMSYGKGSSVPSQNMKLFTGVVKFLYKDVAGLAPAAPGWRRIVVKPALTHRLDHAEARVETPRGDAAIDWRRDAGRLVVDLTVPATSRAELWLPIAGLADPVIRERETELWTAGVAVPGSELSEVRRADDHVVIGVGGGTYRFVVADRA
jgi:alpha-L-rhamnosidase